ncbi:MAG: ABC transporter substrate-binding protein, partial [Oscillospiraceae bacterium]
GAPFDDARVRRAFTLAINPSQLVEQVTKGGQKPATGFIPPSLKFSDGKSCRVLDEAGMPTKEYGIDPYSAQVDEAKALLKEAGFADGASFPAFDFYYNTGESHKAIAEALQEMWKTNLGINVGLKNEEWAVFQDTRRLGNGLVFRGGWLGDYDDPMTMLDLYTSYSGNNDCQWRWNEQPVVAPHDKKLNPKNKDFDDAIKQIQVTSGTERDGWIKTAEKIMMDECIIAPLYYYTYVQIIDESVVEGVARTTMGHWNFKNVKLVA